MNTFEVQNKISLLFVKHSIHTVHICTNTSLHHFSTKAITFDGPEEAVALCAWRLHRSLEPWEVAEPPPRVEEEDERREKGRGKGKSKGRLMTEVMRYLWKCDFGGDGKFG